MSQSKLMSLIESVTNVVFGYSIAVIGQLVVFPLFGINVPFKSNLGIGACFTGISLIRSYLIRRVFNKGGIDG